jgi:hypothetical protein
MASIITTACMNSTDIDKSDCIRGLEQSIKKIGFYDDIDHFEIYLQKRSLKKAIDFLGLDRVNAIGAATYLTKTAIDKSISVKLPTFGICDSVTGHAGTNGYLVKVEWKF